MLSPRKMKRSGLTSLMASQTTWGYSWEAQEPKAILVSGLSSGMGCAKESRDAASQIESRVKYRRMFGFIRLPRGHPGCNQPLPQDRGADHAHPSRIRF